MDAISLHKFFIIIIDTLYIFLLIVVLLNNRRKRDVTLFFFTTFTMSTWVNFAYLARAVGSVVTSTWFLKIAWFVTPTAFLSLYLFSLSLLNIRSKFKGLTILNILLTAASSIVVISTDWIIEGRKIVNGALAIEYGKLMYPFLVITALSILSVLYIFIKKYHLLDKKEKQKVIPFVFGLLFFYIMNLIFNISLPVFLGITRYYYFGDYSTIILASLIVYSMFKHKFLGTKIILSTLVVSIIGMFLLIDIALISVTYQERAIKIIVFMLYLVLAGLLQKSVMNEQKQKELLEKLNLQLDKKTHEQQDMMDVLAHEVKTPISTMVFESEYLEDRISDLLKKLKIKKSTKDAEEIKELIDDIENTSHQGVSIINGLLEFTRIQNKRFKLNYSQFNLIDVVKDSMETYQKMVQGKDIKIKYISKIDNIPIHADRSRIQEAIEGLLTNAEKYGVDTKTGKVDITIDVQKGIKKDEALVTVSDKGIGLTKEDKNNLGQKFYRGNIQNSFKNTPAPTGTGLGLFMIDIIMDAHKGVISVESEGLGKGSSFTLHIPLNKK